MADLEFYSQTTHLPLDFDPESECAVVEQFNGWFVRVLSDQPIVPMLRVGNRYVELEPDKKLDGFVLPTQSRALKDMSSAAAASAGLFRLYHKLGKARARPLTPPLYVGPGSLSEEEYSALLDRLGQLAFAFDSAVLAPLTVLAGRSATQAPADGESTPGDRLAAAGQAVINLHRTLAENWELIRRYPAREVRLVPQAVDLSLSRRIPTPRIALRAAQRPDLRLHEVYLPEEHTDTSENRFLAFVLKEVLLREAGPLAGLLRQRAKWLRSCQTQTFPRQVDLSYRNLWRKRRVAAEAMARHLEQLARDVEYAASWAAMRLNEPFLRPSAQMASIPLNPSARLTRSKDYGPVYKAFQEHALGRATQPPSVRRGLSWALEERKVHPTWTLFEMWVFIETYSMLVDVFGFEPVGQTPLQHIEVIGGKPELPKRSKYALVFSPRNLDSPSDRVEFVLHYSPELPVPECLPGKRCFTPGVCPNLHCYEEIMKNGHWSQLTPDVILELKTGHRTLRFAVDAKYRRYEKMEGHFAKERGKYPVDSVFALDLLGTAKMKYRDALDLDAAFIVHSDPDPRYTVLGSEPVNPPPHREQAWPTYWPGHRFGALYASPTQLRNLEQMIRCLLMYHAGLDDICWSCRNKLTEENGGKNKNKRPEWKGDYYQCPDCGRFWINTNCQGWPAKHRLIKIGRDSFHKTMPSSEWLCVCPACGDEFQPPQ